MNGCIKHTEVPWVQYDKEWKILKNMYKKTKHHNGQTGNSRKFWKFYDLVNTILKNRPSTIDLNMDEENDAKTGCDPVFVCNAFE